MVSSVCILFLLFLIPARFLLFGRWLWITISLCAIACLQHMPSSMSVSLSTNAASACDHILGETFGVLGRFPAWQCLSPPNTRETYLPHHRHSLLAYHGMLQGEGY